MPRTLLTLPLAFCIASGAVLPAAAQDLNTSLEQICQPLQGLGKSLGASVAPGTAAAQAMQKELAISGAQYQALWALLKLTPTSACRGLD